MAWYQKVNTAGLILAGGSSSRLGDHKFSTNLGGVSLLDRCLSRFSKQLNPVAVNLPRGQFRHGSTVLHEPDGEAGGQGPLAGVLLGLEWAQSEGAQALITVPVDVPFFPENMVEAFVAAQSGAQPVCAADANRRHGLCALWPTSCLAAFSIAFTEGGVRTVNQMLDILEAKEAVFEGKKHSMFFNVNTAEDLAKAELILKESEKSEPG